MLTRQHFQVLADIFKRNKPATVENEGPFSSIHSEAKLELWKQLQREVASFCKSQNSGFKKERFDKACGKDD